MFKKGRLLLLIFQKRALSKWIIYLVYPTFMNANTELPLILADASFKPPSALKLSDSFSKDHLFEVEYFLYMSNICYKHKEKESHKYQHK